MKHIFEPPGIHARRLIFLNTNFHSNCWTKASKSPVSGSPIWVEPLQAHLFFLTMYANTPGEQLTFKFHDGTAAHDLAETMFFSADAAVGTVQNPFKFGSDISGAVDPSGMTSFKPYLNVMPNPISDYATIRFTNEQQQEVHFQVTDAAGKLVQAFDYPDGKGMNALLWESAGKLPAGVYLLKIDAGGRTMTEKVVVR